MVLNARHIILDCRTVQSVSQKERQVLKFDILWLPFFQIKVYQFGKINSLKNICQIMQNVLFKYPVLGTK